MEDRLKVLLPGYLLGYATLWLGWACYRRSFSRVQIARGVMWLGAATIVALLAVEVLGVALCPSLYNYYDCAPINFANPLIRGF